MSDRTTSLRLEDQLCFALYAATNAITRYYRPLLQELGLTYPQYLVMLVLWQDGARSVGGIAERLHLGPSAVVPLIDQLERAGFAKRQRDGRDRRIIRVELTPLGASLEEQAGAARSKVACRTGYSPETIAEWQRELAELVERMSAPAEADA